MSRSKSDGGDVSDVGDDLLLRVTTFSLSDCRVFFLFILFFND